MSSFGFEEMPVPGNGLQDVRHRASRLALRARIAKAVGTLLATIALTFTVGVTPSYFYAQGDLVREGAQLDSTAGAPAADRSTTTVAGFSSGPTVDFKPQSDFIGSSQENIDVVIIALVTSGAILLAVGAWLVGRGYRRRKISARLGWPATACLVVGGALVVLALLPYEFLT